MRFFERLTNLANTRAAAALAAVLVSAAPVAAQTTIDVVPETATLRAGKWVVTSDSTASGGGQTMRHPDGGAAKLTTALASPAELFRGDVQRHGRRALQARNARQGRQQLLGQ